MRCRVPVISRKQPAVIDLALMQQFCGVKHVLYIDENTAAVAEMFERLMQVVQGQVLEFRSF